MIFAVGVGTGAGSVVERYWVKNPATTRLEHQDRVEQKIIDWIVERNPKATIKDFSGFPRLLLDESAKAGLDWRLLLAIADKESDMKADAASPKGAIGLFQIMPATAALIAGAKAMEYAPPVKGYMDQKLPRPEGSLGTLAEPKSNLRFAIVYYRDQVTKFGMGDKSLQAYNRGPARAREHWPGDRYAVDILSTYVAFAHKWPAN